MKLIYFLFNEAQFVEEALFDFQRPLKKFSVSQLKCSRSVQDNPSDLAHKPNSFL